MSSPKVAWSGITHRGKVRPNNEDAFLALTFDGHTLNYLGKIGEAPTEQADFVFAVSDGMGGARSGEFASKFAVDRITKLLPRGFRLAAEGMQSGFVDLLAELCEEIHQDLIHLGASYEECAGMGATLSLVWLTPGHAYFCHVGDSRIYYLPKGDGGMRQLTEDHSHVGWLRRTGKISEREARAHPRRNALSQALGAGQQLLEPQVGSVAFGPGDKFLLVTDGIVDGLWDWRLEELLRTPGDIGGLAPQVVGEALEASGRDNLTAVAVEVSA